MAEHPISDQGDGGESDSGGGNREPNYEANAPRPFRPIRAMQYAVRLSQRDNAKHDKHKRYRDAPEAGLAGFLALAHFVFGRAHSNIWIAIFTAVLTLTTIAQWWVMDDQNEIMRDQTRQTDDTLKQMKIGQRAWLGAVKPTHEPIAEGKILRVMVPIKNTGSTPGFVTSGVVVLIPIPKGNEPDRGMAKLLVLRDETTWQNAIPPGVTFNIPAAGAPPFEKAITKEQISKIESGDNVLWILGSIQYLDVGGDGHHTDFCYRYESANKDFRTYHKHNYMD